MTQQAYTGEQWGDGSWGVVDVRPRIPHRIGAAASQADAERIARKMNDQAAEIKRLESKARDSYSQGFNEGQRGD